MNRTNELIGSPKFICFLVKNNYKQKKNIILCVSILYISRIHMYISQYHNSFYRRYETINFIRKSFINSGLKTHKREKG